MEILNENMTYSSDIDLQEEIRKLLEYLREIGELDGDAPEVVIIDNDVNNARKIDSKTGYFDPNDNKIYIYIEGRHPLNVKT